MWLLKWSDPLKGILHPTTQEIPIMTNQATPNAGNNEKPSTLDDFHTSKTGEDKKLDHLAEKSAEKAGKTQNKFDRDHDIFTK
jgi:hypothetical protein